MLVFLRKRTMLQNPILLTVCQKFLLYSSVTHEKTIKNDSSFTISYLVNSCGLSPESALSASKKFNIKTTKNPDSVIKLLKSYNFTDSQVTALVDKFPSILSSKLEKTIRPKLEFLNSISCSGTELAHPISIYLMVLRTGLENRLKPNLHLLKSVYKNKQQLALALRRSSWLLSTNLKSILLPNVRVLKHCGVPQPVIAKLATLYPRSLIQPTKKFEETVKLIKSMGFKPSSSMFVQGLYVMLGLNSLSWKRKVDIYKSLGWSDEEVISAFVKQPSCMLASEDKIKRMMDFYVKEVNWEPSYVAKTPILLKLNLEKRVMPRCLIINILREKELVKSNFSSWHLKISDRVFLDKYVRNYQDQIPEVLQAYDGILGFVGHRGESTDVQNS